MDLTEVHYILGDIERFPDGRYNFPSTDSFDWPKSTTYLDTDALLRIAASEIIWFRTEEINTKINPEDYTLITHNGTNFEIYAEDGNLLYQYKKNPLSDEVPEYHELDYSWVPIGKFPSKRYYIKYFHGKNLLFNIDLVQNMVGPKDEVLVHFAKSNLTSLYTHSFFVVIGIFTALVYLIQFKRGYHALLDFACFTFLIGIIGLTSNQFIEFISYDRNAIFIVSTICANFVFIPMHSGLRRLFPDDRYHLLSILIFTNLIIGLINIYVRLHFNQSPILLEWILRLRIFYLIFAILNFLCPIYVAYNAWKRGSEIGLGHVIGFSITLVLVAIEIYLSFQDQSQLRSLAYWGVLFGVFAQGLALEKQIFSHRTKMIEFEESLLRAEKALKEGQLKALQTKLSPHYLFNSLNTIHALHLTKPNLVGEAIIKLANNYRFLSDKAEMDLISFEEEWSFVEDFLHMQKIRFFDTVKIHLTKEGDFSQVLIPPLTLQPIVENAFKHGFRNSSSQNWLVEVSAKSDTKGNVLIRIADSGNGLDANLEENQEKIWSRSLGNIKARLNHFYRFAKIKISANQPSGLVITIHLENLQENALRT
ncbi:hypothetical protein LPTSP4_24200 [Leptospira ryugenii]|uniref:Signal transduction histidine kinase internal region domain-containing protein n=1 Tax=Leptospira ryugenii TaxID=1917863 RepID=A0A2P2E1V7_9LEPT|nr:hypothetical protein LPTSP4_24200 [Leptospira ryugenii]